MMQGQIKLFKSDEVEGSKRENMSQKQGKTGRKDLEESSVVQGNWQMKEKVEWKELLRQDACQFH